MVVYSEKWFIFIKVGKIGEKHRYSKYLPKVVNIWISILCAITHKPVCFTQH